MSSDAFYSESEYKPRPRTQREVDEGFSRWQQDLSRVAHHALTIGAALLFVIPLVWMIGASLRKVGLPPPSQLEWIPNPIVLSNYWTVVSELIPFGSYLLNSLKVAAVAVPLTIVTASCAGFAMSQIAARPRAWLVVISLATMMVPVTALWTTRFLIYKWIGVLDTLWAIIIPAIMGTTPFYVLLFYWTFARVPQEIYESARLDGAGAFRIWAIIAMPLARPAIVAVGVLSFVFYWSNFMEPLLYLNDQVNYTLPLGLQALKQMQPTNFPLLMAGAVLITIPVLVMFVVAQRYFLQETRGAGWLGR
ncbi:MAG TPA: carbohydrate ABC transporter permease [Chloroflexia bacterium]